MKAALAYLTSQNGSSFAGQTRFSFFKGTWLRRLKVTTLQGKLLAQKLCLAFQEKWQKRNFALSEQTLAATALLTCSSSFAQLFSKVLSSDKNAAQTAFAFLHRFGETTLRGALSIFGFPSKDGDQRPGRESSSRAVPGN